MVERRIVGLLLGPQVPGSIVALAGAVAFVVGLVVLVVVRNEIAQREAVVRGDEVGTAQEGYPNRIGVAFALLRKHRD
jgi:hypothetical protein